MPAIKPLSPSRFHFRPALLAALLAASPPVGALNPGFTLPDLDNRPVRLADFRGQWVIVNFWASWCTPCLLEMPELQAFHETHRNRAVVIGVNFEELASAEVRAFAARLAVTFPIVLSGGNPVPGFELKGLPTTFLVSPTGQIADTYLGTVNAAMLAERLAKLEKAGSASR